MRTGGFWREEEGGGWWNNRSVRSLYCTQNKSSPQDSWGNNVPYHCVCNYTGEGMWPDWLVCQRPPNTPSKLRTHTHTHTHTPPLQRFPSWHFLPALSEFSCNAVCARFLDGIRALAAHQTGEWLPLSPLLFCCEQQCVVLGSVQRPSPMSFILPVWGRN